MSIHGKRMKQIVLTLLLMSSILLGDSVKLRLSSTEVVEGTALNVQIVAEGKDIVFPEIKDVGGFPVEGSSVSSKMESSYINGKFSSRSLKILRFTFYPEIDMTIPAFEVRIAGKKYTTKATKIRVVKPSEVTPSSVNGYQLRITSSKKEVFVGEPFVVTVDFFEPRNSAVAKVEYVPPQFKHFFSQSLGQEKLKRSAAGTIHELQYLLSAKREGNISIIPPKARVGIRNMNGVGSSPWGFFANDLQWHSVRAKGIAIVSKPVPSGVDLIGRFKIKTEVDHTNVKANTPVTYTIKISGEGNLDDLANPKFDIPGVTVYGDDPKTKSDVSGGRVIGSYERKYVFISDKDFTIPSLTFKSFDYATGKSKRLTTKSHTITISDAGVSSTPHSVVVAKEQKSDEVTQESKEVLKSAKKVEDNRSVLEDVAYYKEKETKRRGYPLWSMLAVFFAGIIVGIFGVSAYRRFKGRSIPKRRRYYSTKEALERLYPYTNQSKKVEAMVRKLYEIERGNSAVSIDKEELADMIYSLEESEKP